MSKHDIIFEDESLTKQSFKDECDINVIMRHWSNEGIATHLNGRQARYEDFSNVQDYHTSLNLVIKAQEVFDELPASLRARFENDPGQFLDFVGDPANIDEMVDLGLVARPNVKSDLADTSTAEIVDSGSTN